MNDSAASFVELKYFSPFDINKIPYSILEDVYYLVSGEFNVPSFHTLTLPELLVLLCDETELRNGIRKELMRQ